MPLSARSLPPKKVIPPFFAGCYRRGLVQARDALSNSIWLRDLMALGKMGRAAFGRDPAQSRLERVKGFQMAESPALLKRLSPALSLPSTRVPLTAVGARFRSHLTKQTQLTRSLVLKAPGAAGEKGVLLVQFEYNWYRLLSQIPDWSAFQEQYEVIWGTSWSPTDYALLDQILARQSGPTVVLASVHAEREKLSLLDARLCCPPVLSACDWLDPDSFQPKPHRERQTDILMVANWAPFKRHHELFQGLKGLPKSTRVTLIGQKEGPHTRDRIWQLARDWGVRQDLEILESLPVAEVHRRQCDAKISLILSRREGSCVAATEALFANTPLGMHAEGHVGALAHINDKTGVKLHSGRIQTELARFLERSAEFEPRQWALENISCQVSWRRLNEFMKNLTLEQGRPWTRDLMTFAWKPYPIYLDPLAAAALAETYEDLARRHPQVFSSEMASLSHR